MLRLILTGATMVCSGIKHLKYKKDQQHLQSTTIIANHSNHTKTTAIQSTIQSTINYYYYQLQS